MTPTVTCDKIIARVGGCQEVSMRPADVDLRTERLGPLPLVNHFLSRLGVADLFEEFVPSSDSRCRIPWSRGLGVLLRSILVEREPIYRQQEVVATFAPSAFGLEEGERGALRDDHIGRALDRLFDADRETLLTKLVVAAAERFAVSFDELHNDSTSVKFTGQYASAKGRSIRGKKAPFVTFGHSKDHRPDLKQLLLILTTTRDGAVPVQFRCDAGNRSDVSTHIATWEALCRVAGNRSFLYVADSKLCSREAMEHIDRKQGRFVTVLPRSRREDEIFREWLQDHDPEWRLVINRPNPRRKWGPRDRWYVFRANLPSSEGWPVTWVFSPLLRLQQQASRFERIARAEQELHTLAELHLGPRPKRRDHHEVRTKVDEILRHLHVERYLHVSVDRIFEHSYRQERPGRPGPDTKFVRKTKTRWRITWKTDHDKVAYDHKSDGMYPLICNDRKLMSAEVLKAHKRQPMIERRFQAWKNVYEIAPVFLKNEGRIEALFFLYFVALLVQAIIERELRRAMQREAIESLPLYPEERKDRRPTAEQIFRLFGLLQRNVLTHENRVVKAFEPELTNLQKQVLALLGVPSSAYARGC